MEISKRFPTAISDNEFRNVHFAQYLGNVQPGPVAPGVGFNGTTFSADCRYLALGSTKGAISVWHLAQRSLRRKFSSGGRPAEPQCFLDHGNRLIVCHANDHRLCEWDLELNLEIQSGRAPPGLQPLAASGSNPDDAVKLWSGNTGQELLTLDGTGRLFNPTAFSPDHHAIGTLSIQGFLQVWQAPSWEYIHAAEAKK